MSKGSADGSPKKRLVTSILVLVIFCDLLYLYSKKNDSSTLEYGSKIRKFRSTYLGADEDVDDSPPKFGEDEEDLRIWKAMSTLVERMCWKIAAKRNQTVIWVKPLTNDCYMERPPGTQPPLCRSDDDPDAVYNAKMEACITPYSEQNHRARGSGLAPWPARLTTPPPRLGDFGFPATYLKRTWKFGSNELKITGIFGAQRLVPTQ
ncbi:hypothetical protein ACFX2C_008971 [Malus domestica]